MLPLKLSITGLYSYQKKQIIDFEQLTNAGLFGIFGPVGSGKSSVLEAIGFVLYGETDRLNKADRRAYNMLNLKSDSATIEFEFLNFEEQKFRFVAHWKRKKRFEETTPIERLAYQWKQGDWIPLLSADATALIGLSYENFRRTIIIPQGKFSEFLGLKGKERSDMMKDIFNLQRFDLASKVACSQSTTKSKLDQLKGALMGFETISLETIASLETEMVLAKTQLQKDKIELELAALELQEITTLKLDFDDLEKKKNHLLELIQNKPAIATLQQEIDVFENTEKIFKSILNELFSTKKNLQKTKENYEVVKKNIKKVQDATVVNTTRIDELRPQYNELEKTKTKVSDLESIEKIHILKKEVARIEKNNIAKELLFLQIEKKEKALQQQVISIQTELNFLKSKKIEGTLLMDLGSWYAIKNSLTVQLDTKHARIKIIEDYLQNQKILFSALQLPIDNWKSILESKREVLLAQTQTTLASQTQLLVSKELAHFAARLRAGENCPLCGALEHPKVMQPGDLLKQLEQSRADLLKLENQTKDLAVVQTKALKIEQDSAHALEQLQLTFIDKETLERDIKIHWEKFVWTAFDPTDDLGFLAKKQQQQQIEKTIIQTENRETETRLEQQNVAAQLKIELANKALTATEIATKIGEINNELSQLKTVSFLEYAEIEINLIREQKIKLHQQNTTLATEYVTTTETLILQNNELAGLEASFKLISQQAVLGEQEVQEIQNTINELLQVHQFDSINSVQEILSKTWNLTLEKNKIYQFTVDYKVAENAVAESNKKVCNKTYKDSKFEEIKNRVLSLKLKQESQLVKVGTLQDNLMRIKTAFIEKASLLAQFELLTARSINLGILANMFNGSGFVNYVSSVYLQNLAAVANVRFHRMTKNQLSLALNSANEFEVIDYLNNGASRSVKTLSGGQGFQASLCLALALAESVQSLNKNNKNFFFIDEGFGTQDPESISVVFETLQSLYKENRIVGIISHVAELQEQIPRSISITKEEETGSVVNESWN